MTDRLVQSALDTGPVRAAAAIAASEALGLDMTDRRVKVLADAMIQFMALCLTAYGEAPAADIRVRESLRKEDAP